MAALVRLFVLGADVPRDAAEGAFARLGVDGAARLGLVEAAGAGRDHNGQGFTAWLAGGGVKGGMTYGATDEFGYKAVEGRCEMHDLHATMLHLTGVDHTRQTFRFSGRDMRLTDVHGRVIEEILA